MAVQNEDTVLIASYDAAWPKRGNGHTYDSLAGISNTESKSSENKLNNNK